MRGPRPTTIDDLVALSCRTVIDLDSNLLYKRLADLRPGHPLMSRIGKISVRRLPLGGVLPPTEQEVVGFLAMVNMGLQRGSVYFHCHDGHDRTGYMAAQYRIRVQGWSPQLALEEMYHLGFSVWRWHWARTLSRYY